MDRYTCERMKIKVRKWLKVHEIVFGRKRKKKKSF